MPTSPTAAQSAAARRNGALSTGPTTPEGKARAARNGTTHGLSGRTFALLPEEDPAEFQALLDAYLVRCAPRDEAEDFWVERIAMAAWRLRRIETAEAIVLGQMLGAEMPEPERPMPSLATLIRYRARIERDHGYAVVELERVRTTRPAAATTTPPRAIRVASTREPEPIPDKDPLSVLDETFATLIVGTSEPEPAPGTRPPNRAERRRLKAKARYRAAA